MPISDAEQVIASIRPEFRSCYQAGLKTDPLMQGCVVIVAKISAEGEVASNEVGHREGLSPELAGCLLDVVKRARFAAPGGNGSTLNIPITFIQPVEPRRDRRR